jgi:cobalamin biosynthesis protein CobC
MNERETTPEGADELRYHGGNINLASGRFPHAPRPWIDLSTGINPVPYPVGEIPPSAWTRLPESAQLDALEAAARSAYGAGALADVIAAPGTQALIQWLPHVVPARRVGIFRFTYGEHETCWRNAGSEVATVGTLAELAAFDVGVVVNPNNPDGCLLAPGILAETAQLMAQHGGLLIVDEAFMDVCAPQDSLVPCLPATAVVLRSFGKIYGLAGVRLGFAVAQREIASLLRRAIGPWAVSGPAIDIGLRALSDTVWLAETVAGLKLRSARLDGLLQAAGFEIAGGTPLFRLAERVDAAEWFDRLGQAGILTRPFLARPSWLRVGIPDAPDHWARLEAALEFRQLK